jgi:hypothetical protein
LPGRFLFAARSIKKIPKPAKVNGASRYGTFFPGWWNQKHLSGFKQFGLGSMSLILLHHLLFHLDLRSGGTSYGANRIPAARFARHRLEETP